MTTFQRNLKWMPDARAITDPYVSLWETKKAVYNNSETHWTNGTVYVLNLDDITAIAYGYAEP